MKFLILLLSGAFLLGGCGYQLGSVMHPQIKTIGVAPVVNETIAYNVAPQVRALLCERFQTDGSLKLVDEKSADCIIYARVLDTQYTQISWSNQVEEDRLLPNQWQVTINIEYVVMIPGQAKPLISTRKASGSTRFMSGPDLEVSRSYALRQAAFEAAKTIVSSVTEAW